MELGANVTLTQMGSLMESASQNSGYQYCQVFVDHLKKVGNTAIRNVSQLVSFTLCKVVLKLYLLCNILK